MERIIFLGAPGCGKGTQAVRLSQSLGIAHISTGEMLRAAVEEEFALGLRVKSIMDAGQLVPDDLMVEVIRERILERDCESGYILDGFPRTVAQAEALGGLLEEGGGAQIKVLLFEVSDEDVAKRLAHRRGAEGRADDSQDVQRERLRVYREQTEPLISFYDELGVLHRVSASGTIEEVEERVVECVSG